MSNKDEIFTIRMSIYIHKNVYLKFKRIPLIWDLLLLSI